MNWNPFKKPPVDLGLYIKLSDEELASFREGNGRIELHSDHWFFVSNDDRGYWFSKWAGECSDKVIAQHLLRKVSSLVFRRLNAARDAKDKKTIATLTEIQEAMR